MQTRSPPAASAPSTSALTPTSPPAAAARTLPSGPVTRRSRGSADPRDLRFKLQRKNSQQGPAGQKSSGIRDLREKLSGTMHPQPSNADPRKGKPVSEVVKVTRRETADERPVRQIKKVSKPSSSKKTSQPKADSPLDSFLKSLGLEKYSINFQAEEVDMAALRHMTESDLKALGIPMGPRKKITLALAPRV